MTAPRHFLIVFDHRGGHLKREIEEFDDTRLATDAYQAVEREFSEDEMIEVVLIGSDSLETVRRTHANYFDGTAELNKFIATM